MSWSDAIDHVIELATDASSDPPPASASLIPTAAAGLENVSLPDPSSALESALGEEPIPMIFNVRSQGAHDPRALAQAVAEGERDPARRVRPDG